jgi:hypothetical protein
MQPKRRVQPQFHCFFGEHDEVGTGGARQRGQPTDHPRIMKAHEDFMPWPLLEVQLTELQTALRHNDVAAMKQQLATLVHGYQPAEGISDWVHLERDRRRSFR